MTLTAELQKPEIRYLTRPPQVCPKPNCGNTVFARHTDGWQCLNCMKIIYRKQLVIEPDNDHIVREGSHRGSKYCFVESSLSI
jgi:ribosomal protein S27AE